MTKLFQESAHGAFIAVILAMSPAALAQSDPDEMLNQFEVIDQLVIDAAVEITVHDQVVCENAATGVVIEGDYQFHANGANWRVSSDVDPGGVQGLVTDVAWNGSLFQYLDHQASMLSITTGSEPAAIGMALVNPLLELMQPQFPLTDSNENDTPRMAEVRQKAAATSLAGATWETVVVDGRTLERTILPGNSYESVAYVHHLFVRPGQRGRPIQIDRVSAQGQVITRATFDGYDRFTVGAATMYWPRNGGFQVRDPASGDVEAEMSYAIRSIAVNESANLPPGVFTLSWDLVDTVVMDGEIVKP